MLQCLGAPLGLQLGLRLDLLLEVLLRHRILRGLDHIADRLQSGMSAVDRRSVPSKIFAIQGFDNPSTALNVRFHSVNLKGVVVPGYSQCRYAGGSLHLC